MNESDLNRLLQQALCFPGKFHPHIPRLLALCQILPPYCRRKNPVLNRPVFLAEM